MSNSIYREMLKITDYQEVQISRGSSLLSVAPARGTYKMPSGYLGGFYDVQGIDLWFINRPTAKGLEVKGIYMIGTGNPMPDIIGTVHSQFLGTCVMDNGLVWHVFTGPIEGTKVTVE